MTKTELIAAMATRADITRDQARLALEAFTDSVSTALQNGQDVRLPGFGTFVTVDRRAGSARNPRTGEFIARPASRTARLRVGEALKSILNG